MKVSSISSKVNFGRIQKGVKKEIIDQYKHSNTGAWGAAEVAKGLEAIDKNPDVILTRIDGTKNEFGQNKYRLVYDKPILLHEGSGYDFLSYQGSNSFRSTYASIKYFDQIGAINAQKAYK